MEGRLGEVEVRKVMGREGGGKEGGKQVVAEVRGGGRGVGTGVSPSPVERPTPLREPCGRFLGANFR